MITFNRDELGLYYPEGYNKLYQDQKDEICNGMGPKGWGWLIPDNFFGLDISEAGNRHDYCYWLGGTRWDKFMSDFMFLINMCRLIYLGEGSRCCKLVRYFFATRYFLAVFWGGNRCFNFKVV
jgi:hypothetical protein